MTMEFFVRAAVSPARLGVFPGTFNPPTRAHLALAHTALAEVDAVIFVLPRTVPHKDYECAAFEQRIELLRGALRGEPRFSLASTPGGLFIEIARACRGEYGQAVDVRFVCGRDAAERIMNWDYGSPTAVAEMLREFGLLVAPRAGPYQPPPEFAARVRPLAAPADLDLISATEVRRRIRAGEPWRHLVPEPIVEAVGEIYCLGGLFSE